MTKKDARVYVDFGEVSDNGCLSAVITKSKLSVGQRVLLADDDGNECWGLVEQVADGIAWVRPIWATWLAPLPNPNLQLGKNPGLLHFVNPITRNYGAAISWPTDARLSCG